MSSAAPPTRPRAIYLLLPFSLYLVMGVVFSLAVRWLGREAGYLLGFVCYWLMFGLAVPVMLIGKENFTSLLRDRNPLFSRRNCLAAGLWFIICVVTVLMYGREFCLAPLSLILLSIPLAVTNGVCEELFWRGLYVRAFPGNAWLGIVYPAAGFALWHLIPQSVFPAENIPGFILSTLFLGLAYGFIAFRSGSARWTAISHSLSGIMALSGLLAANILSLLNIH